MPSTPTRPRYRPAARPTRTPSERRALRPLSLANPLANPLARLRRQCTLALLLAGASAPLAAQSVRSLLSEGDAFTGLGDVVGVVALAVNDEGEWLAEVVIDPGNEEETLRAAVLNGAPILVEGDFMANTGGENLAAFGAMGLDEDVRLLWNLVSDEEEGPDEYVFDSFQPLAVEGGIPSADPVSVGFTWASFGTLDPDGQGGLVLVAELNEEGAGQRTGLLHQRLGESGGLESETLLLLEGDPFEGGTLQTIGLNRNGHDIAAQGDHWAAAVADDGPATGDAAIVFDGEVVIREGDESPLEGFTWGDMFQPGVDVTAAGSWLAQVDVEQLGTSLEVLVVDGEIVRSAGDVLPTLAPDALIDFGNSNGVHLGLDGGVVAIARTDSGDESRDGVLIRGDTVLVQEGVTSIEGSLLERLRYGVEALDVSPSGRYVIFRGETSGAVERIMLLDLGLALPMASCTGSNQGTLAAADGFPIVGQSMSFALDDAQSDGALPFFFLSNAPFPGWPDCGAMLPFGELLIDLQAALGNPVLALSAPAWLEGMPSLVTVDVPLDVSLAGPRFYAQGVFWDAAGTAGGERFRLTGGMELELALP